ncbi:MAG: redoxin domain-containing protein [Candidatus Azobacteroides sp.]|nr:redoxin domain-containing protein [Candidatus Azobacteroides sp.]
MYPIRNHIIFALLSLLFFISCGKEDTSYIIEGKVKNTEGNMLYAIFPSSAGGLKIDTIQVKEKGNFSYRGNVDSLSVIILAKSRNNWIPVFIEPRSHIHVNSKFLSLSLADVKGGENDKVNDFRKEIKPILEEKCKIEEAILEVFKEENEDKNIVLMDQLYPRLINLNHSLSIHIEKYVEENNTAYSSAALLLEFFCKDNNMAPLDKNLSLLQEPAKSFYLTRELIGLVHNTKQVEPGKKAPDFMLKDTSGKDISLSDFSGQYVILHFWASDEPFSRMGSKYFLNDFYNKYVEKAGKKFSIIGVSLDNEEEKWKETIIADNMSWVNVSDLKGIHSEMMYLYGLYSGPKSFLIDPDGMIIGDDMRTYNPDNMFLN